MNQAELIDAAKKAIKASEAEVARRIDISAPALNTFKKSKPMPDRIAKRLAELAGIDPVYAVASIEAEKAGAEMKAIWVEIAKRTAQTLTLVIAVGSSLGFAEKADADQHLREFSHSVYYVKLTMAAIRRRFLSWIKGLMIKDGLHVMTRSATHGN